MHDKQALQLNASQELNASRDSSKLDWRISAGCLALGWAGVGPQTYLLREFLIALGGSELSVGLGLATWLSGIALGAALVRGVTKFRAECLTGVAVGLLAPVGVCGLLVARMGPGLVSTASGELIGLGDSMLLAMAVFAVPGMLIGATFVSFVSLVASKRSRNDASIGILYVLESLGSLAAGAVVTWVLIPFTSPCIGYCALLTLALLLWLPAARHNLICGYRTLLTETILLAALCTPVVGHRIESALQELRFESLLRGGVLLDWTETPYSHLALSRGETHAMFSGGSYTSSFPDAFDDEARAHPLMLLNQAPRHVLILGGFDGGMLQYMLKHPVQRIDWVSIDEQAHAFISNYLDPQTREAFRDPRLHRRFEDPRSWLLHASTQFDLIFQLERAPTTLMLARNATLEFANLLRARLTPGGTLVTRFASAPNAQVGARALLGASLYATMHSAFPFVRAIPEPLGVLLAGARAEAVAIDHETITRRWNQRAIRTDVVTPETLIDLLPVERLASLNGELALASRTVPISTDNRPVAFLHTLSLRQELTNHRRTDALANLLRQPQIVYGLALLPSLLLLLIARSWSRQDRATAAVVHCVIIAGATGMALDLLVLFSFQTYVGALYSEIGLLSGIFMLGLALGGHLGRRSAALLPAQATSLLATLLPLLFWANAHSVHPSRTTLIVLHGCMLLLTGAATGLLFPIAANALLRLGRETPSAASAVEAADHFGAALAALVTSIVLVPVAGLKGAALLLLMLQSVGLMLSASALRSRP